MTQSSQKIDFTTFVLSIASAAYIGMGISPNADGLVEEKGKINLELASQNIDLLELIAEKTKGNRSADEDRLIQQLLFETRMRYLELSKLENRS